MDQASVSELTISDRGTRNSQQEEAVLDTSGLRSIEQSRGSRPESRF